MAIHPGNLATTDDFKGFLNPKESAPIFEEIARQSIVQKLGNRVEMGPTGVSIPYWEGDVQAQWTKESGKKPLTKGGFNKFTMEPEKITAIFAMSAEVVRANPQNYINVMRQKVAEAFAVAFDEAALHGLNSPFDSYVDQTTKETSLKIGEKINAYAGINNGLELLVKDKKKFNGVLLDTVTEPLINGSVDNNDRPLFLEPTYNGLNSIQRQGTVLGRQAFIADHVESESGVGYMGDWSKLLWGQIGGISYDVSDSATLDLSEAQDGSGLTSLWQHNLVAVRCEAEFSLRVHDVESFVKIKESDAVEPAA